MDLCADVECLSTQFSCDGYKCLPMDYDGDGEVQREVPQL